MTLLAGLLLATTGCRYLANRYYDFRDLGSVAVGITAENSQTGLWPPDLGLYVEATDFLHLGAITHNGYTAEWDLRGSGVYMESRTRLGLLFWQAVHIDQDYMDAQYKNYFKTPNNQWEKWMRNPVMCWAEAPAKDLTYDHWIQDMQYGVFLRHRGWQYWEYCGAEAAICEPFLTHLGVYARAGFDVSEFSDFLLGWFCIDFKHDDLTPAMFDELRGRGRGETPVEEAAPGAPAPNDDEMAKLRADNDRLTRELAECKGKLRELEGGIEIELPEEVLFDTGRAVLRTSGKRLLDEIAAKIEREYPGYRVVVQGHTDSQPVVVHKRFFRSNWELGSARANAVIHYLESKGISIYKSESYAANKPAADNDTKEGRQRNRRSVIVLTAKK